MTNNFTISGKQHHIQFKDSRNREHKLTIASIGSSIREYTIDGLDIIVPYNSDEMAPHYSGQVLFPWPNRLEDGKYEFEGKKVDAFINEKDRNNQLHGLSALYSFDILEKDENWAKLGLLLPPNRNFPYLIRAEILYTLTDDGLEIKTFVKNEGRENAPFALGWHPWFAPRGELDNCTLQFRAASYVYPDSRLLPTKEGELPAAFDFSTEKSLRGIELDDAFADLEENKVSFKAADGHITTIRADENYKSFQICTADFGEGAERRFGIAIEPMTAYANAFKTHKDLITIAPEQIIQNSWKILFA
jgi:aldose 1-epimerase